MQSGPVHPLLQRQTFGDLHSPWFSHPEAQTGTSQVEPVHPSKQTHLLGNFGGKLACAKGRVTFPGSLVPIAPASPSAVKSRSTPLPTLKPSRETINEGELGSVSTGSVTTATSLKPDKVISMKATGAELIRGSVGRTWTAPGSFFQGPSNGYTVWLAGL